jgi:uncharacterized membrane protein
MRTKILSALTVGALAATGLSALTTTAQAATTACTWRTTFMPLPAGATWGSISATSGPGKYAGSITDTSDDMDYKHHAGVWTNGSFTDLGELPGLDYDTDVNAMNSSGTVVGAGWKIVGFDVDDPIIHSWPFRSVGGHLEQLPIPAGAYNVTATAITANGDIWGSGHPAGGDKNHKVVYLWPADQPGTVTTPASFPLGSEVAGVDADGTVAFTVGAYPDDRVGLPYLWKNGVVTALPLPSGAKYASVSAISNGRLVGQSYTAGFEAAGVLWETGVAKVLPNARFTSDINSSGQILGQIWPLTTSLWQLTTFQGALPKGVGTAELADDGSLLGSAPKAGTDYPLKPVVSRCS